MIKRKLGLILLFTIFAFKDVVIASRPIRLSQAPPLRTDQQFLEPYNQRPYRRRRVLSPSPLFKQFEKFQSPDLIREPCWKPPPQLRPYESINEAMKDIQTAISAQLNWQTERKKKPLMNHLKRRRNLYRHSRNKPFHPRVKPMNSVISEIANRKGSFAFPQIFLTNLDEDLLPPPRGIKAPN